MWGKFVKELNQANASTALSSIARIANIRRENFRRNSQACGGNLKLNEFTDFVADRFEKIDDDVSPANFTLNEEFKERIKSALS